ncbi:MAG TPA: RbsD/FucU domain-containing protein, partial [Tepidisphaeraceae bacterium]|nr:RbsD/FucU domain-containing protein [Tepidisphaeraceae bacterium]
MDRARRARLRAALSLALRVAAKQGARFQSAIGNRQSAITFMLKSKLLHPDILAIIARGGHHSKILIADGNYPAASTLGPNAELVSLQLMPGVPTVTQVLEAVLSAVPVERANTMDYEHEG